LSFSIQIFNTDQGSPTSPGEPDNDIQVDEKPKKKTNLLASMRQKGKNSKLKINPATMTTTTTMSCAERPSHFLNVEQDPETQSLSKS